MSPIAEANMQKCALIVVASALLASCQSYNRCAEFAVEPTYSDQLFYALPELDLNDDLEIAVKTIEYCYDKNPFEEEQFKLTFDSARKAESGLTVLIFEFLGISDARVAFVIDEPGTVEQIYRFSAL